MATQVAQATFENEFWEDSVDYEKACMPRAPLSPLSAILAASAASAPSGPPKMVPPPNHPVSKLVEDECFGGLTVDSLLSRVPTPSRFKAPAAPPPTSVPTLSSSSSASVAPLLATPAPSTPAPAGRASEPWGARDSAAAATATPTPSQKGYREWLQSRGQQAMQRSRVRGGSVTSSPTSAPAAPPATAASMAPPPPPGAAPGVAVNNTDWAAPTPPPSSWPANTPQASWASGADMAMQQTQAVQQLQHNPYQSGQQAQFQPWFDGSASMPQANWDTQMPPMLPVANRQQQAMMPLPMGADCQQNLMSSPMGGNCQQLLMPPSMGGDCQQVLMASPMGGDYQQALMPSAMGSPMGGDCQQTLLSLPMGNMQGMGFGMESQQALGVWPACTGSPMNSPTGSPSPQEMMATFVGGGGFCLDESQIAQALREAAPCVYDD